MSLSTSNWNLRAIITIALGAVYLGGIAWSLVHGKLEVQSFINGVGPSFGMALGYWFRESETENAS